MKKIRIVGHKTMRAGDLAANPANWRIHPEAQREAMRAELDEVGWVTGIIYNTTTKRIIDGHLRADIDPEAMVPVTLVRLTEEEEKRVLLRFDPLSAMAEADMAALESLQAEVEKYLEEMETSPPDPLDEDGEGEEILADELQKKWQVQAGQVWVGGGHRVMCGDSRTDLARLTGGARPDLLHTDPPYGVNIVKVQAGESVGRIGKGNPYAPIIGDDAAFDPGYLLDLAPAVVLWGGNYYADKLPNKSGWFVWDKREGITRNSFADCEMAWTNRDGPARIFAHLWNGYNRGSQNNERRYHPTEKPVDLFIEIGLMMAPQGVWLDLYAGSGPQVVAAERVGARCWAMELHPPYVAVILERLEREGVVMRVEEGGT
jgi:16S rRNA G966 N2-methylase RsmD